MSEIQGQGKGFSPLGSVSNRGHTKAACFGQMEDINAQAQLSVVQQLAASGVGSATILESSGVGGGGGDEGDKI